MAAPQDAVPIAADQPSLPDGVAASAVDLYWLPVGAGGRVVRFSARGLEFVHARLERRTAGVLYHCALEVRVPEGQYVIELTPIPDGDGAARGVTVEGPVGSRWLSRFQVFRYELRCWRGGIIPDVVHAVASPQRLTDDPRLARRLLDMVGSVPALVWGRDELHTGEMWNSNSVVSWLIARSGLPVSLARPPAGGRAPGWKAGLVVAQETGSSSLIPWHRTGGPDRTSTAP